MTQPFLFDEPGGVDEPLEEVREIPARQEVEELAARIDWNRARKLLRPPQAWFEGDEPKPF